MADGDPAAVDPVRAGLKGRCPRCGKGKLFSGFLSVASACDRCGLDFEPFDTPDGPAFFVMTIVGFVVVALALYTEVAYSPPVYVHLVLWIPLTLVLALPLMRFGKGLMAGLQYRNKAGQGQLAGDEDA